MDSETIIPAETFVTEFEAPGAGGNAMVKVTPKISVKGTTFKIKLTVEIPTGSDTKTFTLSHANNWHDKHTFFSWPQKTDITIEVDRKHKRIHIRVAPPIVSPTDKYFPFSTLMLPGDFGHWQPHGGPELAKLEQAIKLAKPVGKSPGLKLSVDHKGVAERCTFLGDGEFPQKATHALQSSAPNNLQPKEGGNVLFALGVTGDAGMYVGGSLGGGFWFTDDAQCGLYGGIGAQMGAIVGANLHLVYTIVIAQGGKSAMENFEQFHIARGVVGEGVTFSVALLGDIQDLDIFGIMYGGGIGGGAPAGGYVGASRQALLKF